MALPFVSWTEGALHVAAVGAPVQVKEAVPAKPGPGVNCRVKDAVCPAVTVTEVPPATAGAMVKAGLTLALMAIVCGESAASSTIVIVADWRPAATGAMLTLIAQVALAA
jgi:hypothetical protein